MTIAQSCVCTGLSTGNAGRQFSASGRTLAILLHRICFTPHYYVVGLLGGAKQIQKQILTKHVFVTLCGCFRCSGVQIGTIVTANKSERLKYACKKRGAAWKIEGDFEGLENEFSRFLAAGQRSGRRFDSQRLAGEKKKLPAAGVQPCTFILTSKQANVTLTPIPRQFLTLACAMFCLSKFTSCEKQDDTNK